MGRMTDTGMRRAAIDGQPLLALIGALVAGRAAAIASREAFATGDNERYINAPMRPQGGGRAGARQAAGRGLSKHELSTA